MSEKQVQTGPVVIEASVRTGCGKSYTRKLRRAGKMPGNLMQAGKATSIEFDPKNVVLAVKADRKFNLVLNGKTIPVVIKDIAVGAVKRELLHLDLMPQ